MGIFTQLGMENNDQASIDWEINPANSFTIFESWGSKTRMIRNNRERYYYFFIDTWRQPARLCLMERGIKHAKILAEIKAPDELIKRCVSAQGSKSGLDKCYAVNEGLKDWLCDNILRTGHNESLVTAIKEEEIPEDMGVPLALNDGTYPELNRIILRQAGEKLADDAISALAQGHNFFDKKYNPAGRFDNYLVDNGDKDTAIDLRTGLMWQRYGCDITSIRHIREYVAEINDTGLAGFHDWRLPTMEEAWSLLERKQNNKGLYLHPAFGKSQPFIFLADARIPGGYWFMDFKQGTVFWASGTIPGGFGRLCRSI